MDFTSVHNAHERTIFDAVVATAPRYPGVSDDAELLADVACVALNRLTPRYTRRGLDLAFFTTHREREATQREISESVDYAFGFVQARNAMAARR